MQELIEITATPVFILGNELSFIVLLGIALFAFGNGGLGPPSGQKTGRDWVHVCGWIGMASAI